MISLDTFIGGRAGRKLQASGPMAAAWGGVGGGGRCYHGKRNFYVFQPAIVERFLAGYYLQNT